LTRPHPILPAGPIVLILIPVLAIALGLGGCASVEKDKRAIALYQATTGYESALRWGYFENALDYLHPDDREDLSLPEQLTDLRVVGYESAQSPVVEPSKERAVQLVTIDYLYEDRQVVKQLKDRQLWEWDEEGKTWWLMSGLPKFE
jgi:hypothetical protein